MRGPFAWFHGAGGPPGAGGPLAVAEEALAGRWVTCDVSELGVEVVGASFPDVEVTVVEVSVSVGCAVGCVDVAAAVVASLTLSELLAARAWRALA
jgi:hypothetical protein